MNKENYVEPMVVDKNGNIYYSAKVTNELDDKKDKEIERLNKENKELIELYQRTCTHLFNIGNDELARYFQAQINECNTFTTQGSDKE